MKYTYDEEHDALGIYFRDGDYYDSEEIYDGFVIDFDKSGRPLGLDIYYDASKFVDIERLRRNMAPEPIPREAEPRRMVIRDALNPDSDRDPKRD
jgi:uncharacterized protein YuzE